MEGKREKEETRAHIRDVERVTRNRHTRVLTGLRTPEVNYVREMENLHGDA